MMLKQGSVLVATGNFSLRKAKASRVMNVKAGDRFWVTNSITDQKANGLVTISREGQGHISCGHAMREQDLLANFAVRAEDIN